jgi:hypothetical protein
MRGVAGRISVRRLRSPNARAWEALRQRLLEEARRMKMRAIFVAALVSLGLGLVGVSSSLAAPGQGAAIAAAAEFGRAVDQAHWRPYRYRHWWWRHHRHHRWWY